MVHLGEFLGIVVAWSCPAYGTLPRFIISSVDNKLQIYNYKKVKLFVLVLSKLKKIFKPKRDDVKINIKMKKLRIRSTYVSYVIAVTGMAITKQLAIFNTMKKLP